jgi:hypothetical protein
MVLANDKSGVRTAVVYRTEARSLKDNFEQGNYNASDEVQFEMCVFSDGRVAHRWLVGNGSCVWWDSLEDLYNVHIYAHPDYGTRVEWSDGTVEQL